MKIKPLEFTGSEAERSFIASGPRYHYVLCCNGTDWNASLWNGTRHIISSNLDLESAKALCQEHHQQMVFDLIAQWVELPDALPQAQRPQMSFPWQSASSAIESSYQAAWQSPIDDPNIRAAWEATETPPSQTYV